MRKLFLVLNVSKKHDTFINSITEEDIKTYCEKILTLIHSYKNESDLSEKAQR